MEETAPMQGEGGKGGERESRGRASGAARHWVGGWRGTGEGDELQGSVTMAVVDNEANKRGAVCRGSKRGQQECTGSPCTDCFLETTGKVASDQADMIRRKSAHEVLIILIRERPRLPLSLEIFSKRH